MVSHAKRQDNASVLDQGTMAPTERSAEGVNYREPGSKALDVIVRLPAR